MSTKVRIKTVKRILKLNKLRMMNKDGSLCPITRRNNKKRKTVISMKNRAGLLPLTTTKKWLRSTLSTKNQKSNKIPKTFLNQRIGKTPRINSP